jgi:hypothetical protein
MTMTQPEAIAPQRHTAQGHRIDAALVRGLITTALAHDAITDEVNDLLLFHILKGRYHPSVIAVSPKPLIAEILDAATGKDRQAIADELIADARSALGEQTSGRT